MAQISWPNPSQGHSGRAKGFCLEFRTPGLTAARLLDLCVGALNGIDAGQFWRVNPTLEARPEISQGTYSIQASANYQTLERKGLLTIDMTAQPHNAQPWIGLFIWMDNQLERMPLPWHDHDSERIAAITILFIQEYVRGQLGEPLRSDETPIGRWEWFQPCCGWIMQQEINYQGWFIKLGS